MFLRWQARAFSLEGEFSRICILLEGSERRLDIPWFLVVREARKDGYASMNCEGARRGGGTAEMDGMMKGMRSVSRIERYHRVGSWQFKSNDKQSRLGYKEG